jgi:hypothetical protein
MVLEQRVQGHPGTRLCFVRLTRSSISHRRAFWQGHMPDPATWNVHIEQLWAFFERTLA